MADPAELLEKSQWDFFWVPEDTTIVDRPELAFLSNPRPIVTLNCVYRVRPAGTDPAALVEEVSRAHTGPSRWQLPDTTDNAAVERALRAADYDVSGVAVASAIDPATFATTPNAIRVERVTTMAGMRDAVSVINRAFGSEEPYDDAQIEAMLAMSVGPEALVWRFVGYDADDRPVTHGGMSHHRHIGFGLLWGGCTIEEARGRGAYRAVVGARLEAARAAGIGVVGLYAMTHSSAPIVARLGFRDVGRMHHWLRSERGSDTTAP